MEDSLSSRVLAVALLTVLFQGGLVGGCNTGDKEVGVCLHVYLERDFLTMERIVYPTRSDERRDMLYNRYHQVGSLQQLPPLPDLDDTPPQRLWRTAETQRNTTKGRHNHTLITEGNTWRRAPRSAVPDAYGEHGWVEGPELEDYCSRLGTVITCFEVVLINCDNSYDFFRYRHLLHSLEKVHQYLCHTAEDRSSRFLPFLKVINCAEKARMRRKSCHRPNVTVNVWNQILRLEVGPEVCDSLNTQRACLLENQYVREECGGEKEDLYRNVSGVFLATWCRLPIYPHYLLYSDASSHHHHAFTALYLILPLLLLLQTPLPRPW